MAKMTVDDFLKMVNKDAPPQFVLGTVDTAYTTGAPRILFDGDTVVSSKKYSCVNSYNPTPGDRVILCIIGGSFVVLGSINNDPYKFTAVADPLALTVTGTADTTYSTNEVTMINALVVDITNLRNKVKELMDVLQAQKKI